MNRAPDAPIDAVEMHDLRAAVDAVLALHVLHNDVCVYENSQECDVADYCNHCKQLYPCATVRALAPVADPDPHTTSEKEQQ
jgi:hypothetical protein